MTGARCGAALICVASFWYGISAAQAAPDEAKDESKTTCLAAPKGTPPAGEKWFYRVERGTKRHCWYTRAIGSRRVAESVPAAVPAPKVIPPKVTQPPPSPEASIQLDQSVANARAEANISATAAIAPPQPEPAAAPPNWQLAQRWSDHANGGAPFESKPAAAPTSIAPPVEAAPSPSEPEEVSTQRLFEIAGGAFGFAALATVLVMIFARRQRRTEASTFALFATTDDPKRRLAPRRQNDVPSQSLRPRLADDDEVPLRAPMNDEAEPPMRAFTPRNMRMDRG